MNRSKTAILVLLASPLGIYGATATLTNTLNANVGALGALAAPSTAALTNTGTIFNAYTGMVALQYRARTSAAGGGALTMKVTQDFQTGGPSVAAGDLTYQCGSASLGTACAATTASTSTATQVVTLPLRRFTRSSALAAVALIAGQAYAFGQFAGNGTTTLSVAVAAESAISITSATTNLTEATGSGIFGARFTGTTNFSYKVRTTTTGGSGSITVKITADFAAGGPSVATPPTGDAMTYSCTAAASATACTGPITASTTTATTVATFATNAHSTAGTGSSDAGTLIWTLPNDPVYKTGTYTATATLTISAT